MPFSNIDTLAFWAESDYANQAYVGDDATNEDIKAAEEKLGYKLPDSYLALIKIKNGGIPKNTCFPTSEENSWAKDHIAISGIMGIDVKKPNSVCGEFGSKFWIEEWGYPNTAVYIADCPSAGHHMVMLDYTNVGADGEPEVVYIDQENNYQKILLAKNFETFIQGLVSEDHFASNKSETHNDDDLEEEWFADDF